MAKWNRRQVGSIVKKKEEDEKFPRKHNDKGEVTDPGVREFSIKITEDITLRKGEYINLENKAFKLRSLEAAKEKMSEEVYGKSLERIQNMPDFVAFEMIKISKES